MSARSYARWGFNVYNDDELPGYKVCEYCGEEGLHWEETPRGWRLHDSDGDIHVCDVDEHDLDGFEVL